MSHISLYDKLVSKPQKQERFQLLIMIILLSAYIISRLNAFNFFFDRRKIAEIFIYYFSYTLSCATVGSADAVFVDVWKLNLFISFIFTIHLSASSCSLFVVSIVSHGNSLKQEGINKFVVKSTSIFCLFFYLIA